MVQARVSHIIVAFALAVTAVAAELVADPGFETGEGWTPYPAGASALVYDREITHSGEQSLRIHNDAADELRGASQRIVLEQQTATPLQISGWSRAEGVGGAANPDYGVWLDIEYMDDTRPGRVDDWVQLPFDVGTHDWQRVQTVFTPQRPIRHFTLHALFRRHAGTAWFDDISVIPLTTTRTSGVPADFDAPPPGLIPEDFASEVRAAGPGDTVLLVSRERSQDYHVDSPAASVDAEALAFAGDQARWHGRCAYANSVLVSREAPTTPGLHLRSLVGNWGETQLALTAVGERGNAYRVFVALPAGQQLRATRFEDWEPSFDSAGLYRLGDRVILSALLEVMSGSDTVRLVMPNEQALAAEVPPRDPATEVSLQADDGLALHFSATGALAAVETGGREHALPAGSAPGGWLAGEAGLYVGDLFAGKLLRVSGAPQAGEGEVTLSGTLEELRLSATATFRVQGGGIVVSGEVRDLSGEDRAIDVALTLPVRLAETDLLWHDLTTAQAAGEAGRVELSPFPWMAVTGADWGLGIGIDGHYPARQSVVYDPTDGHLHARIKLGIIHDAKPHLQGRVPFGFVIMPVDPQWGARDAAARYYAAYPDLFEARPHREGLWMFGRLPGGAEVPNPEDFSYFEGPAELPEYLRAAGVRAAPYIIPNQRSLTRLNRLPADYDEAMALLAAEGPEAEGWGGTGSREIIGEAAIVDAEGRYPIRIRDDIGADFKPDPPIFNVVFPVNPDPDLASGAEEMERIRGWAPIEDIGAVYTDSGSAWSARYLNFRTDHFRVADLPLTYDEATGRVAIFGKAPPVEHWRAMGEILHPVGKLVFPNLGHAMDDPWSWFATDICGSESGSTDTAFLNYARTLAHHKPVLFLGYLQLMGRDTPLAERESFLRHVRRCALMGIMPSITIRPGYPEWYAANGDIYRQYMPIIKRLSAAGWEPVTHARVDAADVRVERFGPADGTVCFTVLNEGAETVEGTLSVDAAALGAGGVTAARELVTGASLPASAELPLSLGSQELAVIEVTLPR